MDPNEILKAAPEIAKGLTVIGAAIPLTPIIKAILGPAADELGQRFGDRVRLYRYGRSLDMLKKAEKMALDAGFTPKAVPIKLLFPLLDGASFEENEDLHTMWAALLANAASPATGLVRAGFLASLEVLSPDEAALLNWAYDQARVQVQETLAATENPHDPYLATFPRVTLVEAYGSLGYAHPSGNGETVSFLGLQTCLDSLQAAQLIQRRFDIVGGSLGAEHYSLTARGWQFVTACRPPKPKA